MTTKESTVHATGASALSSSSSSSESLDSDDDTPLKNHVLWRDRMRTEAATSSTSSSLLEPIEQDETCRTVLRMSYSEAYKDAGDYFRAVVAAREISQRALDITADVIRLSPANYSAWYYRKFLVTQLNQSLQTELDFTNSLTAKHQKNYQLWNNRQWLVDQMLSRQAATTDATSSSAFLEQIYHMECAFLKKIFKHDAKNYHCWTYRVWLIRRLLDLVVNAGENAGSAPSWAFASSMLREELSFTAAAIDDDVYNNSAWNYRFQLVKFALPKALGGFEMEKSGLVSNNTNTQAAAMSSLDALFSREFNFIQTQVQQTIVHNESVWSYALGLVKLSQSPLELQQPSAAIESRDLHAAGADFRTKCLKFAKTLRETSSSYHLLGFLVDILTLPNGTSQQSGPSASAERAYVMAIFDELCQIDEIRARYWTFRRQLFLADKTGETVQEHL